MDTTKNVFSSPAKGDGLVGINLTTAGHLADGLERAAAELGALSAEIRAGALLADLAPTSAVRLDVAAAWAAREAGALRALVARLARIDAPGVARWWGGRAPAFADPLTGYRRAQRIVAALWAGNVRGARLLLEQHGHDPVVATVVVEGLGATGLVRLLHPALVVGAGRGTSAFDHRALATLLGQALARSARHGTSAVTVPDLAGAAEAAEVPLAALALLFVGGARFPDRFVRDAVTHVVAPLNAATIARPGPAAWIVPRPTRPLDARAVILQAAARSPQAALEAVGAVDLDLLLDPAAAYDDGGVALAAVLRAATAPRDATGALVTHPLTSADDLAPGRAGDNARRLFEWIGAHRAVPLAVHVELGRLARPWIGSFRAPGLEHPTAPLLHLDDALGRSFLAYAAARDAARATLDEAAWGWAAAEVDHLAGPRFDGSGFAAVGSVIGRVTTAGLDADAVRAADADRRAAARSNLWRRATGLVLARLPGPARRAVDPLLRRALRRSPDEAELLRHWRDQRDPAVLHEHLALEYLVASALWNHRAENGYLRPVPPALLVDPARPERGLRLPVSLDGADAATWQAWRARLAARGPAPLQAAGEQLLLETRRPATAPGG